MIALHGPLPNLHILVLLCAAVAMVTELDPDAPSRQRKQLQADDAKDEERLMARVFRLLRAGEQQHRGSGGPLSGSPASAGLLSL